MPEAPRSNRPTPRTAAAIEAELRRRVRQELEEARGERSEADGQLEDAALAAIIARAISAALQWHLEAPEHTRNATLSSRTWRGAGGPRGGRNTEDDRPREYDRPPRDFPRSSREYNRPPRDFPSRPPRDYDQPPRDFDRDRDFDRPPPRDFDRPPPRDYDRGPRQYDPDRPRPPRQGGRPPGPRGGNYKRGGPSKGGGFRSRKPR
jgi:hypothetical protein